MSKKKMPNWTLQVVLDSDIDYFVAQKFIDDLASDIKQKLADKKLAGVVVATTVMGKKQVIPDDYNEKL